MKHLDEGTIHAWLDGALDDVQAREVSGHAASCARCGALVAEARGLIAGASRILTALDDVPAGIAPKRAPVVASSKPTARRYWQAAPWVT
ncbi:MAG: zf-HC2 domain-containing protein, partial [Gemmatimonadota bacterium]